jgi:hypothetical protein
MKAKFAVGDILVCSITAFKRTKKGNFEDVPGTRSFGMVQDVTENPDSVQYEIDTIHGVRTVDETTVVGKLSIIK